MLAYAFLGEGLRRGRIIGLLVTLAGVAVVLDDGLITGGAHLPGYLMIVAAGVLWAA